MVSVRDQLEGKGKGKNEKIKKKGRREHRGGQYHFAIYCFMIDATLTLFVVIATCCLLLCFVLSFHIDLYGQ